MSSIIDDFIFFPEDSTNYQQNRNQIENLGLNICKAMKSRDEAFQVLIDLNQIQAIKKIEVQKREYLIRLNSARFSSATKVSAILLEGSVYYRSVSHQVGILLMKELGKRQRECFSQGNFCINLGRVMLILNNLLILPSIRPQQMAQLYLQIIIKNLIRFSKIQQQIVKIIKNDDHKESQIHHQLKLSNFLCTTQTNAELSGDKSQYKFAKSQFQKQNNQLKCIQNNIIIDKTIERSVRNLFLDYLVSIQSLTISQTFTQSYLKHFKNFSNLLNLALPVEKNNEDYLYSVVHVQILQKLAGGRPIGEGGTSLIFPFRAMLTFQNQEKIEKIIVVKKMRVEYEKKLQKMTHEKSIVAKLSNSTCHFLPKYYAVEKDNELSSCLLMEMIQGQELDGYIAKHTYLSLWSKIYIMLNVIQGIRHLIEQGIIHLDLKPINVLVCKQLITKIIDYGDAYHPDVCPQNYAPGFTFPYVAPEVISHILDRKSKYLQYSEKQDAFAFGIMLSQIFFDSRIFYLSNSLFKETYAQGKQLERYMVCPERLEAYGDDIFMSTILLIIQRCVGESSDRPRFEWINIILKLMLNSFINTY